MKVTLYKANCFDCRGAVVTKLEEQLVFCQHETQKSYLEFIKDASNRIIDFISIINNSNVRKTKGIEDVIRDCILAAFHRVIGRYDFTIEFEDNTCSVYVVQVDSTILDIPDKED